MKSDEFIYIDDLLERHGNQQCFCGGWAMFCGCKYSGVSEEDQKLIEEYLEEINT